MSRVPVTPVGRGWTFRFSLAWLGIWMAYLVPIQLALPDQLADLDHPHRIRDFGLINGMIGVTALLTLPIFGALCDRTRSRFGRRRLWIVSGTGVFAAGLAATGAQTGWVGVALAWTFASLGVNMASVGLTATIADRVPDRQRGMVSSAIYGPQALGVVLGLVALSPVTSARARYLLLAVAVAVLVWLFASGYREVETGRPSAGISLGSVLGGRWLAAPDFGWAFGGRLGAALLGAGYGAYMSVDQVLITEVLPDVRDRARDLSIMTVGSVGPQAFGPLAASLVISVLGGYRVLFAMAGLSSVAGAVMVYRIRSVR